MQLLICFSVIFLKTSSYFDWLIHIWCVEQKLYIFSIITREKWFDSTENFLNKWKLSNVHPTKQNLKRDHSQNFFFVDILLTILNVWLYFVFFIVALHLFHVFHIFPVLNENCNKKINPTRKDKKELCFMLSQPLLIAYCLPTIQLFFMEQQ